MKMVHIGLDETTILFLRRGGFIMEETGTIENVEDLEPWLEEGQNECVVVNLDAGNFGIYLARHLRKRQIDTPVIGIKRPTEDRSWSEERAIFLENGGDDLITGPANPRELIASVRAVTRRFKGANCNIVEVQLNDIVLKVNITTRSVNLNGRNPNFTSHELDLVIFFAENRGRTLSKEALLGALYAHKPEDMPEIKIIDVFVHKIRKKLNGAYPYPNNDKIGEKLIETVWGQGYRLVLK